MFPPACCNSAVRGNAVGRVLTKAANIARRPCGEPFRLRCSFVCCRVARRTHPAIAVVRPDVGLGNPIVGKKRSLALVSARQWLGLVPSPRRFARQANGIDWHAPGWQTHSVTSSRNMTGTCGTSSGSVPENESHVLRAPNGCASLPAGY